MAMNIRDFGSLLKDAAWAWLDDKAPRLGAALAYYTTFAMAPLLIISIAVGGMIFGKEAAQGRIMGQVQGLIGKEGGEALEKMLASADKPGAGATATIIGTIMLLFAAAGLFGQLQDALNTVWEVKPKEGRGIWGFVQDRFLSLSMVLGTAFLLLVSLVFSALVTSLGSFFGDLQASTMGHFLDFAFSFVFITLLFAMIYKYLPDALIAWRDVWVGAAVTSLLFAIGKQLIGLYLGYSAVASAYGAAGSLAVLLIWLYYSSQIFLFGAELTKAFSKKFGKGIVPAPNAEPATQEAADNAKNARPTPTSVR